MTAKKLIALHAVQFAIAGVLTEVQAGQPLVLDDEKQIAHLFNAEAIREATADEAKTLFNDGTPTADNKPVADVVDLSGLTKAQLLAQAAESGVKVDEKATKAELVKAIEAKTETATTDELL